MNLFGNNRRNRAIAACARALPPRLARDYGASQFYTPGQIARAIANLKLDPACALYAYATFLPEAAYLALRPPMPSIPTYGEARAAFAELTPAPSPPPGRLYDDGVASGVAWLAINS